MACRLFHANPSEPVLTCCQLDSCEEQTLFQKMPLKMTSAKRRQYCLGLDALPPMTQSWFYPLPPLRWHHNDRDGVSNHWPHDCLLRRRSKETSKLRVTGLCAGNSPLTGEFTTQRASNAENISIWWRHHDEEGHNIIVQRSEGDVWPSPNVTSLYQNRVRLVAALEVTTELSSRGTPEPILSNKSSPSLGQRHWSWASFLINLGYWVFMAIRWTKRDLLRVWSFISGLCMV